MISQDRSDILGKGLHSRLAATALSAAAAVALAFPAPAHAEDWGGLNSDRSIAYFPSDFGLAPGDTNFSTDLYANDAGSTRLISAGDVPGSAEFAFASEDGSLVYFYSNQSIAPDGSGNVSDLYVKTPTGTQRVTPAGKITSPVVFIAITPDGSRAWMITQAPLVAADTDTTLDIYEYRPASKNLVLLSQGTTSDALFEAGSMDGSAVWLRTAEALEPGDTDGKMDVYRLKNGSYVRVTPGNGPHHAYFDQVGRTSGALLFTTSESLVAADTDAQPDIYRRVGLNTAELVTTSSSGAVSQPTAFEGADTEAGRVVFRTADALVAADTDTSVDVYAVENGTRTLLSDGPDDGHVPLVEAMTDDASTVLLRTASKLLPSDTDTQVDLYRYSALTSKLVHINPTNTGFAPVDARMAPTAAIVAWETDESLSAEDTDETQDVYLSSALGIQLASKATDAPLLRPIVDDVQLRAVLPNGHVLFTTMQRLTATDKDSVTDLYEFWAGTLTHVSRDTSPPDTFAAAVSGAVQTSAYDVASTEEATFECRVDTGSWFACSRGVNGIGAVAVGAHTVEARATDVAGNVDPTPASVTIVVESNGTGATGGGTTGGGTAGATDMVAPRLAGAKLSLRRGAPSLSFNVSEAASVAVRLQRRVGGHWKQVRTVTKAVAPGSHRIKLARRVGSGKHRALLVAKDTAGNSGARLTLSLRR